MDVSGYAFIVGGGSGIGRASALGFAKEGAAGVMVADIDVAAATAVAAECKSVASNPGFKAEAVHIDVTLEESVGLATAHASKTFGRIDYCVTCAGIGTQDAVEISEANVAEFRRFMDVNVTGTFLVTRAVSAVMKRQDPTPVSNQPPERAVTRGTIVNMGSGQSFVPGFGQTQYTTSKHAVLGLSRNAALDNVQYGIRVNCLCPSWVDTPLVERAKAGTPGLSDAINNLVPMGRVARPEEVSDAIIFLSSPRSSYVTGSDFVIDGGTILRLKF
ncbi:NAD(P)-binding protein [Hypoxylon sp. FL1857]|nr:NAD(P)-binding protein [Hypoxylon sp. FL1857]